MHNFILIFFQIYRNIGRTNFIRLVSELCKVDQIKRAHETCVDLKETEYEQAKTNEVRFLVGDDKLDN
jgi:hypothetical protein